MSLIHNLIHGITKLTPNWSTWQKDAEVILESEDLFSIVNGSATPLTDAAQLLSWQKWDKHAYTIIYLLVSSNEHHIIAQASVGSNAWPLLRAKFKKDVASNWLNLCSNLYNVTHDPSKPVTELINTIQSISHQLATIKHPLHATEITDMIFLHLHESFSPVCSALIICKEEPMLTEIIAAVKEHETHTAMTNCLPKGTSGSNEISSESVYFTGKQQKQGGVWRSASKAEINWVLKSCSNGDQSWISDVGDDQWCQCWPEMSVMLAIDGVWTDFGFSFDATPTTDMVLYFRVETKEDGDRWRKMELA